MTLLDTRTPDFPSKPQDGFQIKEDLPDGGYVIWTYSEQFNQWTYELYPAELNGFVYTDQVRTRETTNTIMTQKDVNKYLAAAQSRIATLETAVKQLQEIALRDQT